MHLSRFTVLAFLVGCLELASPRLISRDSYEQEEYELIRIPIKKHYKHRSGGSNFQKGGIDIGLINGNNMGYGGMISVGTPGQKIRVDFDTGSSDLFVASPLVCANNPRYCQRHKNLYYSTKSSTSITNYEMVLLPYGSEDDEVLVTLDNLEIGGLKLNKQLFGQLVHTTQSEHEYPISEGIFGLAYPSLSLIDFNNTVFTRLVQQGGLKRAIFSFYLNGLGTKESAELVLGGYDPAHFTGPLTYAPVIEKRWWTVQLDGIKSEKFHIEKHFGAMVDSGTTLIIGPPQIVHKIWEATGLTKQEIDCSSLDWKKLPTITFSINGRDYHLTGKEYTLMLKEDDNDDRLYCTSGFSPGIDERFILGDVFMRKFYTVFDMEQDRVGFALAK